MTEDVNELLANLLHCYMIKDDEIPHLIEEQTILKVCNYLKANYKGKDYTKTFFDVCEQDMKLKTKWLKEDSDEKR